MVSSAPLDSPTSSFRTRLPSVARLKARGPQGRLVLQGYILDGSGAFRSAKRTRPAPDGRALLCAADNARETQGITASQNLPRRTEPSPRNPRFAAHLRCVSAKRKVWGVKRGQETILGVLSPFALAGETPASPPPDGGNFPESFIKALPEQRPCAPATESAFRSFAARFLLRVPVRRSTAPPCARW